MPKTTRSGQPKKTELPATLQRSPKKAQRTFAKAHDSAVKTYGEGARAHRVAYAALKQSFKKVGDRWEPKDGKGPSDPRARRSGAAARRGGGKTHGGVEVEGSSKQELYKQAKRLGIEGRSQMSKRELVKAIAKAR